MLRSQTVKRLNLVLFIGLGVHQFGGIKVRGYVRHPTDITYGKRMTVPLFKSKVINHEPSVNSI